MLTLRDDAPLQEVVDAVHAVPYGRAPGRTPEAVLESDRGTCSTKHYLLNALILERHPDVHVSIVHRVYRLDRAGARRLFSPQAAAAVPPTGLVDVHTFMTMDLDGHLIVLDVTFPVTPRWDGETSMTVQCGPGEDHVAELDAETMKAALVAAHCDPAVREPFIAALSE